MTVTNISGTSHTLSATNGNLLQVDGRNYFWKVTAKDDAGNESVSPEFQFNLQDIFPPRLPSLLYPLANDTVRNNDVDLLFTKTFDINAQTDASDAVLYKVTLKRDLTQTTTFDTGWQSAGYFRQNTDFQEGTALAIKASDLLALSGGTSGTQWYRWRVYVKDANGFQTQTASRVFKFVDKSVNYAKKLLMVRV